MCIFKSKAFYLQGLVLGTFPNFRCPSHQLKAAMYIVALTSKIFTMKSGAHLAMMRFNLQLMFYLCCELHKTINVLIIPKAGLWGTISKIVFSLSNYNPSHFLLVIIIIHHISESSLVFFCFFVWSTV